MGMDALKPIEILLVEDNPTDRAITIEALERSGLLNTLNVVEDGVDAMLYLRAQGRFADARRPDLVLLDLNLPRKDGREVLAEIKNDPRLMYIPVIVLTTSKSDQDLLRAYGHHANGYIPKPLGFGQLAQALRTLGGYWFSVVTLPAESAVERLPREDTLPSTLVNGGSHLRAVVVSPNADAHPLAPLLRSSRAPSFDVRWTTTLEQAANLLLESDTDLCFVDLELRESSGLDSYHQAKRAAGSVPVIVLTAQHDDPLGTEALRAGADDYLSQDRLSLDLVTRSARYVLDRRQTREQLRRAQKLETLGRLVAGVAHDFNNLISVVKGSAELLLDEGLDDASRSDLVLSVRDAAQRAEVIARQLTTFSRQRPMSLQHVELNQVIGSFTRLLRRMLGESIHLELHLTSELPNVLGDSGMLDQVLLNLALNARDAMPQGGRLRLLTSAVAVGEEARTLHRDAYPGWFAKVAVSDTGVGIEAQVLAQIFDPFFTTKASRNGTGLGLAMVHSIVHQHKGWVSVNSQPGIGSTFEVFLPVAPS